MNITTREFDYFSNLEILNDRIIVKIEPLSKTLSVIGSEKENKGVALNNGKKVKQGDIVYWSPLAIYEGVYLKELKDEGSEGKYAAISESLILFIDGNK